MCNDFFSCGAYIQIVVFQTILFGKVLIKIENAIFTRGQFWPSGIVAACVCVCLCVCVSVNHELARAIIHQPFKLGLPNLDQRCKDLG